MNVPKRMPVYRSQDKIRTHWLTLLCAFDLLYGLVNMFGKAEGPGQLVLRGIAPIPVWYGLLVLAAVLIWFGWSVPGGSVGAFALGFQAAAALVSITNGTALNYGGPLVLGYVAWQHALVIYDVGSGLDADRERRQQRR